MSKYIIIGFLILTTYCFGQVGQGIVKVNPDVGTIIEFYTDTTKQYPDKQIEIFLDETIKSIAINFHELEKDWLLPEYLKLDYDIFFFRVIQQTDEYYQVLVNNKTGLTYWIKKQEFLQFQDWETFLKDVLTLSRLFPQPIKSQPEVNAKTIEFTGDDCFHVKQMQGYWIEITTTGLCNEEELTDDVLESGWIKWRDDNNLLIKYYLLM